MLRSQKKLKDSRVVLLEIDKSSAQEGVWKLKFEIWTYLIKPLKNEKQIRKID